MAAVEGKPSFDGKGLSPAVREVVAPDKAKNKGGRPKKDGSPAATHQPPRVTVAPEVLRARQIRLMEAVTRKAYQVAAVTTDNAVWIAAGNAASSEIALASQEFLECFDIALPPAVVCFGAILDAVGNSVEMVMSQPKVSMKALAAAEENAAAAQAPQAPAQAA